MNNKERYIAVREGWVLNQSDEYFAARPHVDNVANRNMFEAGAERMYNRIVAETTNNKSAEAKLTFLEQYVLARAGKLSELPNVGLIVQDAIEAHTQIKLEVSKQLF
jgi:hypothetical protein